MKPIKLSKEHIVSYGWIVFGSLLFALGQSIFIRPLHIPMGGISGIALVLNYLYAMPVGVMTIVLNLPLFFIGYRTLGRVFFVRTVVGTVISSVIIDTVGPLLPVYEGDILIAALYGGIIMGAGFGFIFRGGGTSGGTDIIAKYLNKKNGANIGGYTFVINAGIILVSALIYQNIESALYAIVSSYLTGVALDKILYGGDVQKQAIIITTKPREVADTIMHTLGRGVTKTDGLGMYTDTEKAVLICAVRRYETAALKRILQQADGSAFLMISELSEVFGQGFKKYDS